MEEQNGVNEENDRNTQRQETRREKVGNQNNGNSRRDCHQTETCVGKRGTKKNN